MWWKSFKSRTRVFSDELPWKFDPDTTGRLSELLSAELEDTEEDVVQTIKLSMPFPFSISNVSTITLPSGTRQCWQQVLENAKKPTSRSLVVGTPGVGKSSSIPYFIRRFIQDALKFPDLVSVLTRDSRVLDFMKISLDERAKAEG